MAVILSARGPKRFLQGVPEERFLLFGAEFGGGKRRICFRRHSEEFIAE